MIQSPLFWSLLAATVAVFWLVPPRRRSGVLVVASLGYLGASAPLGAALAVGWSLAAFWLLRPRSGQRPPAAGTVAAVVAGLLVTLIGFKYLPSLVGSSAAGGGWGRVGIPLGISYFTFKLVHWSVETGRGNIADRSLGRFLAWISLFPAFPAGPIERYDHFVAGQEVRWRAATAVEGVIRIVHGLIKKILIADGLLLLIAGHVNPTELVGTLNTVSPGVVWRFAVVVYLRAYIDFSAYSDLAIGAALLFGIRLVENFDFPVLASNIGSFWQRWHMSLVAWCRSYIYMPLLGVTRSPYLATVVVFLVIGVWHCGSLHWLLWGCYHAVGVIVFRWWTQRRRVRPQPTWWWAAAGWLATQLFVAAGSTLTVADAAIPAYDGVRLLLKLFAIDLPA